MSGFAGGEPVWVARLDGLRNTVRQELIARQLVQHVSAGRVLDVGCGQGTQAVRLTQRGCVVTGVDPSPALLTQFADAAAAVGVTVETLPGGLGDLDRLLGARQFDVVCAHGLLMYLEDREEAVRALAQRVAPGGLLSLTFRNAQALAFRPGIRGQWSAALRAFEDDTYVNELGLRAGADQLADVCTWVSDAGLQVRQWYGVRVFTDGVNVDTPLPVEQDLELLLQAEYEAGRRDPYRQLGAQIHLIAIRQT